MTTVVKITNEGPEHAMVWAYTEQRQFKPHADLLKPGESISVNVWDGHLPVVLPAGRNDFALAPGEEPRFFPAPPTTMAE